MSAEYHTLLFQPYLLDVFMLTYTEHTGLGLWIGMYIMSRRRKKDLENKCNIHTHKRKVLDIFVTLRLWDFQYDDRTQKMINRSDRNHRLFKNLVCINRVSYSRITSTASPSFCMTTFRASLTYLTALLPQSRDSSYYVSRPILSPPSLWLHKHTDLRAHDFAHSTVSWHQPRLTNVSCAWCWRLCGINPAIII
jgi:hypothetical protein